MAAIKTRKKGINYQYDVHQNEKNGKVFARVSRIRTEFPKDLISRGSHIETILTFHFDRKPTLGECKKFQKHIENQARLRAKQIINNKAFGCSENDRAELTKRFTKYLYTTSERFDKYLKIKK